MPKKKKVSELSKHEKISKPMDLNLPKVETNGVISGYHSNDAVSETKVIENKIPNKSQLVSQSVSSSSTSLANDVQTQPLQPPQQPIVPPLVLTQKATKTDKKSQKAFKISSKAVTKKKDEGRRVTRHSPQNSTLQTSSSPSKLLTANSTNGRTTTSSSLTSISSPNKNTAKVSAQTLPVAHKRSPSSPVPNQFINTNLVRATKSLPTPVLTANFLAAQKSKTTETNSGPKVEKRTKRKLEKKVTKKLEENDLEPRLSKRVRLQYQPFQSPEPLPPMPYIYRASTSSTPRDKEEDKVVIYNRGEFLAVRNETNSFFICRTSQNVFKNSRKFKIQWFNNDKNPSVYTPDFYDVTDFECILTNLRLNRLDKGQYKLPDEEKQRIMNILQRAINVEKGINVAPDPIQVTADGVDVSVVGKAEEKELLKKISPKRVKSEVNKHKTSSSGSTHKTGRPKRNSTKITTIEVTNSTPIINKSRVTKVMSAAATIRRSTRSGGAGAKTPTISPVSAKTSPKGKKPGIADVVKKLKTRARSAKKAAAAAVKKPSTPLKKTKKSIAHKKKSPKATPQTSTTPSPKAKKKILLLQSNSSVTLYEKDPTFETSNVIPFVSTIAHSKLLIRAVLIKDHELLETLISDKKNICSFCVPRCLAINRDALSYAIQNEDFKAIKLLTDDKLAENLAPFPDIMIEGESSGYGSKHMFGHALRAVAVGRGGKEGNNALTKDNNLYRYGCARNHSYFSSNEAIDALKYGVKFTSIEKMSALFKTHSEDTINLFLYNIVTAVRHGHYKLSHDLIERAIKKGGFGFNALHKESLSSGKQFSPFKAISICKKSIGNSRITPIHCAAINPDPYFLSTLLAQKPDYNITDSELWAPIHYAAVSEGSSNLEYLLSHGISTLVVEKEGNTALHLACLNNRTRNVEVILRHESNSDSGPSVSSLEKLNRLGLTPLHIASQEGYTDVVKVLLKSGADAEKTTPATSDKLSPLMIASQFGHLSIVKLLFECGVNVEATDKRHRTALTHAVMNGHSHIVSYLLRLGANPNTKDSSGNSLVNYASAYGWYYCFKLLIEAKAKPNEPNDWKMTPLCIAFMKGHTGLAEEIIKEPGVNINIPVNDSNGMNLLMQTCNSKPNELMIDRLKFLIEKHKADCTKIDFNGNNALHYLVLNESNLSTYWKDNEETDCGEEYYDPFQDREILARKQELRYLKIHHKELKEKQRSWIIQAAQLLIDNGTDPSLLNKQNMSPFMLAAEKGCFAVLQKLLDVNKKQLSSQCNKEGNTILHLFVSHAINEINVQNVKMSVGKFVRDIHDSDDSLKIIFREMAAIANKEGLKPIHLFLETYSIKYSSEEEERLMDYLRFLVETLESDINSSVLSEKAEEIEFVSHLAAKCLSSKMIEYLLSKKLSLEQLDGTQRTPLAVAIKAKNIKIAKLLIESGSDVKFKSVNDFDRSLLLIEAINNNITFELIPLMVAKGANVNEEDDKTGNTALHYVASRAEQKGALDAVVALIKYGANVNAVNKQGRTALHLAVNSRNGGTDVSFDVEDYLLKSGAKTDICDHRKRIPLHYAFVKIDTHNDSSFMDPIELVALLDPGDSPLQGQAIDVADEFGSTPLHYAAQRGATISCMHLLRRVNINPIDNNDNTPLGLAVLYKHEGCALMLQQKGAAFISPVGNLNTKPDLKWKEDKSCWKWNRLKDEEKLKREIEAKKAHCSIIEEVVRKDWQGILYLMINELGTLGRGVGIAIEAALKTERLNLAIKLLKRVKQNKTLNTDKQTLFHIMAKEINENKCNQELQQKIVKLLIEHEVNFLALDSLKSNAIIYAAINWNFVLCNELTNLIGLNRVSNLEPDSLLRTPVSAIFWGIFDKKNFSELPEEMQIWLTKLLEKSAQLNIQSYYPISESSYAGVRYVLSNPSTVNISAPKYSPLIASVINGNYSLVKYLLNLKMNGSFAVDVNYADSTGRTPLMHAVRLNDLKMVKLLLNRSYCPDHDQKPWNSRNLTFKNTNNVDLTARDDNGFTVLHHLVAPLPNFTYFNSDIVLRLLWHVSNNSKTEIRLFDVTNNNNETPFQIATDRNAKSLIETFREFLNVDNNNVDTNRLKIDLPHFPRIETNFISEEFDYKSDLNKMREKLDSEEMDVEDNEPLVKPDGLIAIENAEVAMDTSLDLPFDVLLTKVDLEYGIYGLYNFYKMQIIQHKEKDLILLFTRWGRIGDIGQYQKTPFATLDEAIKEFKKVFKAKSGNNWENVKQFNAVPKKYRLVDLKRRVRRKEKQYKIDVKKAIDHIESKLPEPLFELMKSLISVNSAKDAFRSYGAVESSTPFGLLNCETLQKSQTILEQIEKLIEEKENMKQKDSADFSKVTLEIIDLSEEFYHLIPVYGYQYERLSPLLTAHELRDKMELISNLLHFEFGVELLLAAQYRSLDVNPADYIYRCLGSHLQLLDRNEEETQLILQYIHNTGNKQIVKSIYRINRNGEEDNFIKNSVGNNWLLWHGTKVGNVLSILAKGLQIAPLGAEISGHLFGKGIYFSDMFAKSHNYCGGFGTEFNDTKFMFLSEVSLGNMEEVQISSALKLNSIINKDKHSLKTSHSLYRPDPQSCVYWRGRSVPIGPSTRNTFENNEFHELNYNEYIVFNTEQICLRYLIQFSD